MQTCFYLTPTNLNVCRAGVAEMACVQQAMQHGYPIVAGGTTNAYVLENSREQPWTKVIRPA